MKKILGMAALILFTVSMNAQNNDEKPSSGKSMLDNGLFINGTISFTNLKIRDYYYPGINYSYSLGQSIGVQFGQKFSLKKNDKFGVELKATYIDAQFGMYNIWLDRGFLSQLSLAKVGPQFTYLLADDIALSTYYQLSPNAIMMYSIAYDDPAVFIGFQNTFGIGFRWNKLNLGYEYNAASLNYIDTYPEGFGVRNNKVVIGVQF